MGQLLSSSGSMERSVTLFVAHALDALRARHGEILAANILGELGRREIQTLQPDGRLFCLESDCIDLGFKIQKGVVLFTSPAVPAA